MPRRQNMGPSLFLTLNLVGNLRLWVDQSLVSIWHSVGYTLIFVFMLAEIDVGNWVRFGGFLFSFYRLGFFILFFTHAGFLKHLSVFLLFI